MLTAGLMTLSMGTAVFADEANEKAIEFSDIKKAAEGAEVAGTGSMSLPVINVVVPTKHDFSINPFEIANQPHINSTVARVINKSEVAVTVVLKNSVVTAETGADATEKPVIIGKDDVATSTKKGVYLELKSVVANSETAADDVDFTDANTTVITGEKVTETVKKVAKKDSTGKVVKDSKGQTVYVDQVTTNTEPQDPVELGVLKAKSGEEGSESFEAMFLKFDGETVLSPEEIWDKQDTLTVQNFYSFKAHSSKENASDDDDENNDVVNQEDEEEENSEE